MSRNLKKQRNRAFLIAMLIGSGYFFMLTNAISKIFSGFVMQLIFLGEHFKNPQTSIFRLILASSFIVNLSAGLILLFLLFWVAKGLMKSLAALLKTRRYLSSLKIVKKTKKFVVFRSGRAHAFTAGFIKPTVYISNQIHKKLKEDKSKAIVFHELGHQENFDPLKNFIVNTFIWSIPSFPGKRKFFSEYSTLVELNCDFYAEEYLSSKRPIIEALIDVIDRKISLVPNHLFVNDFLACTDRIEVLTENRQFRAKNLYFPALILFGFIFLNTIFINRTRLFLECNCLAECIHLFFDGEIEITPKNHQECKSPASEPTKSCFKIAS